MSSYLELNSSQSQSTNQSQSQSHSNNQNPKRCFWKQLESEANNQNTEFIRNIYKQEACKASRIVCFSLTGGMLVGCQQQSTGYDIQGKLF